ncbi:acyl-CoA Delta-9 desaturase-like isoform X1 [Aricia agestis]|uniref:acyl-CoA Delta-9 desaturase-like isoform X1 n=1 Tax=Aricia agestis TaxID=91739 RepID=UPI001C207F0A|nr:acyl-CoA Delta-9 desaturase-like isoform X1 [Aricia agestis]
MKSSVVTSSSVQLMDVPLIKKSATKSKVNNETQIVWRNVIAFIYLHVAVAYAIYLAFTKAKVQTVIFSFILSNVSGLGITAGAHRLWAHKAYKARWPLRLFLACLQTIAFQNHIYEWVRDHRAHHKFSETDADPHNAKRGFFFSHIGWLMVRKHRDVIEKGASVDMSDLKKDPIVMFQKKYYFLIMPMISFVIPTLIPMALWNESLSVSWHIASILRYTYSLHCTWLVNSAAHIFGNKPYDRHIGPTENKLVAILAVGEGWHNYHHVFPWDYKAAELGNYRTNISTALIDLAYKCGLAYDLKTVPSHLIEARVSRTGDGTHPSEMKKLEHQEDHHHLNPIWGWDDKDMTEEHKKLAKIIE